MIKKGNSSHYDYKNNTFSLYDFEDVNLSPIKGYKKTKVNSCINNDEYAPVKKHNSQQYIKANNLIKLSRNNYNIIKDNNDISYNNKSFNKIIQKAIILNNNINLNFPNKKKNEIPTIPIKTFYNNYYTNLSNIQNDVKAKEENKIKNIHISLKKIKIGNLRVLSKNKFLKCNETFVYKSPKRQKSSYTDRNILNNDSFDNMINKSYNNPKLISKVNISPKKNNLIPKPTLKHEIIKRNKYCQNVIIRNKKFDIKLLNQSQEIKRKFRKENEIIKMKNDFFNKNGIQPEKKIEYENKVIKIQSYFRKFLEKKKISHAKNKFFETKICKINEIILNSNNAQISNNNKNSLINSKYILKYLIIKKEQKRHNILKTFFERYKNKTIRTISIYQQAKREEGINNNIFSLRNNKLKNLVHKKIILNKQKLHRKFLQYYYNSFYINFNWFVYLINQISNYQKTDKYNTSNFTKNKIFFSNYSNKNNIKHDSIAGPNYLSMHFNDLKETMKKMSNTNSEELKKFYLRDIMRTINKIREEKEKIEIKKNLKQFALVIFSKLKIFLIKYYIDLYYKISVQKTIKNVKEKSKIN